jgi:hypothetical protein
MKRALLVGMGLVLVGGVVTPAMTPVGVDTASAAVAGAVMPCDFDGDGYADLAVGVPGEGLRGRGGAGAVQVLYGSASGVTAHDQLWHQGRRGVKGAVEKNDHFGSTVACGDFDGDGYADLAIGIPDEGIGRKKRAGAVQVLYGGPTGLTARDQVWHQGKPGVPGANEPVDCFGSSLAAGDFNGDGRADLAIGVPYEDVGDLGVAGAVVVLWGSTSGLKSSGAVKLEQGRKGMPSQPSFGEYFGNDLAAGDVNGDGRDDLGISVQLEADTAKDREQRGTAVHIVLGSANGLSVRGSQYFGLAALGLEARREIGDLRMVDVNGDSRDDLVLSSGHIQAKDGVVAVLHGSRDGVHPAHLAAASVPGRDAIWPVPFTWADDQAGSMAVGDFTGDDGVDLAVDVEGSLAIIIGTSAGLGTTVTQWAIPGRYQNLASYPLSGGTRGWLIVGEPSVAVGATQNAGRVIVARGGADGALAEQRELSQDSPGIKGASEVGDMFGMGIAG